MTLTEIQAALSTTQALAITLWGEARGEPIEGQIAVGCVVRNRAPARRLTIQQVCFEPKQFSCWNDDPADANHQAVLTLASSFTMDRSLDGPAYRQCEWAAQGILSGAILDRVQGAQHYMTAQLFQTHPPAWVRQMRIVANIGGHLFFVKD